MEPMGKTDSGRLAALDLLRLVAALAVLPFHYLFRGAIVGDLDVGYPAAAPLLITEYAPFFASGILAQHIVAKGRSPAALVLLAVAFLISCRTITFPQARM